VALARAFFDEPALVVLDEPNSNLDSAGEQALTDTLRLAKEKGITVVVITQRPAVLNCMDKLLVLRAGRIEAFGPPDEVLVRLVRPASTGTAAPSSGSEPAQLPTPESTSLRKAASDAS
jgi:ATP-binding cassette subfamily C protein